MAVKIYKHSEICQSILMTTFMCECNGPWEVGECKECENSTKCW